ncbi:MAG TPA: sugar transferase [Bacteroidetes bacterium]|nr:sugar transferase [Bacteroidota bacterium]
MALLVSLLLLTVDIVGTVSAWIITFLLRVESGLFINKLEIEMLQPLLWLTIFWLLLFLLRGMYRTPLALSRFNEVVSVFKSVLFGILIIFILTFDADKPFTASRLFLLTYGVLAFLLVSAGRVGVRNLQRMLRQRGVGLWNAVIVGFNDVGRKLHHQLHYYPVWGFRVVGFIDKDTSAGEHLGKKVLGGLSDLPAIIETRRVHFVLVAPLNSAYDALIEVFGSCGFLRVRFMIVADFYQMVVGLVRTVEIHGLPLVEVMPRLVGVSVLIFKRSMDILVGLLVSVILLIITPLIAILIKLDSPGPVFYVQKRIGKWGREFNLIKFRTMHVDAEAEDGAVWAEKNDPRVTRVGRFLRRSHLDELPQFFNVLLGQMSIVGPRPERREFVEHFKDNIPLYERRLRIRPGITGWAQVRHKYDENVADVVEKTGYDLFYIDHISPALDLKIILATMLKMIKGGGH